MQMRAKEKYFNAYQVIFSTAEATQQETFLVFRSSALQCKWFGIERKNFWHVVWTRQQLQKNYNSLGNYTRGPNLWPPPPRHPAPRLGFALTCCSLKTPTVLERVEEIRFLLVLRAEQTMLQTIQKYFNKFTKENILWLPEYLMATVLCSIQSLIWVEFQIFTRLVVSEKGRSRS